MSNDSYYANGHEVQLFEQAFTRKIPVMLTGPTGCGKTRFVEHMGTLLRRPVITISCHDDLTSSDLVGRFMVTGGDVIMRWTTGYPFGVNLARGYPRFNPGEFSTVDLLIRGDCDAALVLGADPGATMPQPAIDHLARVPTIVLDPKVTHTSRLARVHFTTAATGISAPGTVYRMDEIPLPLRPAPARACRAPPPPRRSISRNGGRCTARRCRRCAAP